VLYEAGYEDAAGYQMTTANSSLGAYGLNKGWEVISSPEDLQPGDICFYRGGTAEGPYGEDPAHVNIFVGKDGDNYLCYDCGSPERILALEPAPYSMSSFGYAFRPNDEIVQSLSGTGIEDLKDNISHYLDGINNGTWSVSIRNLDRTSQHESINNRKQESNGWIKLFIMATVYDEVKKGNLEEQEVSSDVERMITRDDNSAADLLVAKIGQASAMRNTDEEDYFTIGARKVNTYASNHSYNYTHLEKKLSESTDTDETNVNYTSVKGVTLLLQKIYQGRCVNREYSDKMKEILSHQLITDKIPTTIDNGVVLNKTGESTNQIEDAAIVTIENANYVLAIQGYDLQNKEQALEQLKEISRMVYTYFSENGTSRNNEVEDEEIDYIVKNSRVYYMVSGLAYQCPLGNLKDGSEMLFELLATTEKTQKHEQLMRYLMYLLTGTDYKVTEFDFEEFLGASFISTGEGGPWSAIWGSACTKEEFLDAVRSFAPPNATGNGGRSCIDCYNRYFVANAENFYNICTSNGMDPRFIFAIGIHESYFGTSNIANTKGNFFGWGAYDWDPMGGALAFADMSQGIDEVSRGLKNYVTPGTWQYERIQSNGYDPVSIEGIGSLYASDPNWANAVKQHMTNIFGCTGNVNSGSSTEMQNKIVELASSQNTFGNGGGWCQAWVADVYARAGQSRTSSCCASSACNSWRVSTDKSSIPLGACVYGYSSNGTIDGNCGQEAGHVGIYIGDGKVASNVGGIRIESLDSWTETFGWKGWGWNGGVDYSR
jgi:hypothetical protein